MAIVVGIDEAGYGPVLGPLVVAAAALEVPDKHVESDLWKLLRKGVKESVATRGRRVAIGDSKQVYQGPDRLARLEQNVLATCPLPLPAALTDFTAWLGVADEHLAQGEPWHTLPWPALPLVSDAKELAALRARLCETMDAAGVRLRSVSAQLVQPWRLNRLIGLTDNKAAALWLMGAELLDEVVATALPGTVIRATMDRQGGRVYYADYLQQTFPLAAMETLHEVSGDSRYRVACGHATLDVRMLEKADGCSLPVALASMYAKYVRELFMHQFNLWWQARAAGMPATSGYWTDYHRWAREAAPHLAELALPEELYIRCR